MRSRLSFCPTPSEIADERVLIPTVMRAQLIPPLVALTTALFLEPSIKAAEESPDAARLVAQTERAFSTRCAEVGIRDSFLEYFAPDAIHFAPEPRLARPDLEPKPSSNRVRLTWEPKIIRVANTGQLAVSTGPYVLKTADGESYGYFLSIWKRQPNADWRVAADIGVAGPQASNSNDDFQTYQDTSDPAGSTDLLAFEREQFSSDRDLDSVYGAIASPETVFERTDQPMQTGAGAYSAFLTAQKGTRTKLSQSGGSVSGNLGFTYGSQSDEKSPVGYLRVWIWRQSRWRLLFDVVTDR
jgi:hypothetical protein